MKRNQIRSSMLLSAGYDPDNEIMELEFISGEVYQYLNVPVIHFTGFMNAVSHGEYFNQFIKDQYSFIRR